MIVERRKIASEVFINGTLLIICILWLIPTIGLLISSFRTRDDVTNTG